MTPEDLKAAQPDQLSGLLLALWHDAHGNWEAAHHVAQDIDTPEGAWVHAYLHRKEGDTSNASYWYRRARRPVFTGDLAAEWQSLAADLLART